jgi:hypothetical protein
MEHETVPVPPAAGFTQMKAGPVVCDSETNVVFGGRVSAMVTEPESDGPLFVTVMVYVMFAPASSKGEAVLTTPMSALVVSVVVAVELLLLALGSGDVVVTLAVLLIVPVALELIWTVTENVAEAPLISVASMQVIVPVPPAEGVVQENAGPVVCDSETNVVFAGSTSARVTEVASDGPLFVTAMVYVRFEPAAALAAAVLTTPRSALLVTVVLTVELLLFGFASMEVVAALAVFEIVPLAPEPMWTVMENVADAPFAKVAREQLTLPVPPTAGVVQEKTGPVVCDSETNVVLAGTASVSDTFSAGDGPLFVRVMP